MNNFDPDYLKSLKKALEDGTLKLPSMTPILDELRRAERTWRTADLLASLSLPGPLGVKKSRHEAIAWSQCPKQTNQDYEALVREALEHVGLCCGQGKPQTKLEGNDVASPNALPESDSDTV